MNPGTANNGDDKQKDIRAPFVEQPEIPKRPKESVPSPLEKAVVDYISQLPDLPEKLVPEADKWKNVRELYKFFSSALDEAVKSENPFAAAKKLSGDLMKAIESQSLTESLGDINVHGLKYLVSVLEQRADKMENVPEAEKQFKEFLEEYAKMCKTALDSEEKSSEPVREQVFLNICNALQIPAYPLERLDALYNDFKDPEKRKGIDMAAEMNRDVQDEIEHQPGIKVFMEQQNTYWDSKRIQYFSKSPDEKEVVGREWDFWKTMTEKKFLLRQSRMQGLKKLTDGEMSFNDMKKEHDKYAEIRSWKMN